MNNDNDDEIQDSEEDEETPIKIKGAANDFPGEVEKEGELDLDGALDIDEPSDLDEDDDKDEEEVEEDF